MRSNRRCEDRAASSIKGGNTKKKIILTSLAIVVLWIWYYVAADYGYKAMSGTYAFEAGQESSILILSRDQLFQQERRRAGQVQRIHGTWRRTGEAGVVFSKEFLTVDGQESPRAGDVYGQVEKGFAGLFVATIAFRPDRDGPVFHKK